MFTFVLFEPPKTISHAQSRFALPCRLFNLWCKSAGIKDKGTAASGSACGSISWQRSWQIYILPVVSWPRVLFVRTARWELTARVNTFLSRFTNPVCCPQSSTNHSRGRKDAFVALWLCSSQGKDSQAATLRVTWTSWFRQSDITTNISVYLSHKMIPCLFTVRKNESHAWQYLNTYIIQWIDNITVMRFTLLSSVISPKWYIFFRCTHCDKSIKRMFR